MAERFIEMITRDYVAHMPKPDLETALRNLTIAFEHYNEAAARRLVLSLSEGIQAPSGSIN